ncbi:hypothetical protein FQN54_005070 [Arachnomyces sp. PD_36]|nr:hypothetical protein FQN54_005070 [Arachnomyces sp. PD_36]
MALASDFLSQFEPPYGFAIRRNGSCLSSESECYATWGGFWGCCPGEATCPGADQWIANNVCCPGNADCTGQLNEKPHCADESWTMFEREGYFCCEKGQFGFWTSYPDGNFGCSDEYPDNANFTVLNPISQDTSSGPEISSTQSSDNMPATQTSLTTPDESSSSSSSSSSTNTGAIAGGVIGGVAGLALILAAIWFFLRRKQPKEEPPTQYASFHEKGSHPPPGVSNPTNYNGSEIGELDPQCRPPELENTQPRSVHEMQ